ncbi:MAG: alanine racemase, partial [Acidobacteria bacterium]|nr:alanine racemase [Acidobacteriota bacterium]
AEISLGAITHNLRAIRKHVGAKRKILCVVKADAYGHGAPRVAQALAGAGADAFGVTCWAEGAELRAAGIRKPILVLTGFYPGEEKKLLVYRLTPVITDVEQVKWLDKAATKNSARVPVHLKIDTGMHRLGIPAEKILDFIAEFADARNLQLAGTFTHFAAVEDFHSGQTADQQRVFEDALAELRAVRLNPGIVHLANSAAIAARPETWADMVRPGALLYGYHQFYSPPEKKPEMEKLLPLQPALSLRARIVSLKDVAAGTGIGYNAKFVATRPSRIAVMAAGYAEGVVRVLTNRGRVILHGRCAPLVGTISMDLAIVDVTGIRDVRLGDVVTIFGNSDTKNGCSQYASDVAQQVGTVTSDILCAVGRRVPRSYTA